MPEITNRREQTVKRWAQSIWDGEIKAGLCSTERPITAEMQSRLMKAAYAAVDAMETVDA